jgi:uncharacterized protein (TIGR03435 family)
MRTLYRRIYCLLLRLHPTTFRNEFACEMALDFENALHTYGFGRLFLDATSSLARQWSAHIFSDAPNSISAHGRSLLAGDYVIVGDRAITPLELGRGVLASTAMFALCTLALSVSPGHALDIPIVSASSSVPAMVRNPKPRTRMPNDESSNSGLKASQSATAASAQIGTATTTLPSNGSAATPTVGCTRVGSAPTQPKPELLLFHPSGPLPSYEVDVIKPLDPNTASHVVRLGPGASLSPLSIRRYIMNAYGAIYSPQVVGGPDWLNKDAYVINGKVPDDLQSAFQKMTGDDHNNQIRMMEQCLLADRFHLKAHYETRILPVYELVAAKKGLKITEVPAPPERKPGDQPMRPRPGDSLAPGSMMSTPGSNGLRVLNGRAIKMQSLARVIGSDVGNRPIVDHSGFTGYFDITDLTWAPLGDAAASEPDAPSLPGALEEKLGLRLVTAKDPIEVLVIDRIDRPTPN